MLSLASVYSSHALSDTGLRSVPATILLLHGLLKFFNVV